MKNSPLGTSQDLVNRKPLYGLVLAGGRSQRMNPNPGERPKPICKAHICVDGIPQWERSMNHLKAHCQKVFLSCRREQACLFSTKNERICQTQIFWDDETSRGPATGIFQAFKHRWPVDWFVMAVDLPGLDAADLKNLVEFHHTRQTHGATAFAAYQEGVTAHYSLASMPEPLCSIWTLEAQEVFLRHFQQSLYSPLAVLKEVGCELFYPKSSDSVKNANYPGDWLGFMPREVAIDPR